MTCRAAATEAAEARRVADAEVDRTRQALADAQSRFADADAALPDEG